MDPTMTNKPDPSVCTASVPLSQFPLFFYNKLRPLLPYSVILYRRCQFHLYDHRCGVLEEAIQGEPGQPELWVAAWRPQGDSPPESENWLTHWLALPQQSPPSSSNAEEEGPYLDSSNPWLAMHIDIREPGLTQLFLFTSWEPLGAARLTLSSPNEDVARSSSIRVMLMQALFHRLRTHHVPMLSSEPSAQFIEMRETKKITTWPYKRSKILFGAVAEANWLLLDNAFLRSRGRCSEVRSVLVQTTTASEPDLAPKSEPEIKITRESGPYSKYLLRLPLSRTSFNAASSRLPTGEQFRAGPLTTRHLQIMLDRSPIPRSLNLLQGLVSVGLFPLPTTTPSSALAHDVQHNTGADPVAWGMLNKDASLGSFHTEDEYRGRGLAERVAVELIKVTGDRFQSHAAADSDGTDEVAWAHVDVSTSNKPSQRVFEKMGAEIGWQVSWIEVDIGEIER